MLKRKGHRQAYTKLSVVSIDASKIMINIKLYKNGFVINGHAEYNDHGKEAQVLCSKPNYFSALFLERKKVDGVVCGSGSTTKETLRAALREIGKSKIFK